MKMRASSLRGVALFSSLRGAKPRSNLIMSYGLLLLMTLLTGCSSTSFKQPTTNDLGYLDSTNDGGVTVVVNEGVDTNQFKKKLYVSTEMHGIASYWAYQDYVMEAFRQLNFFDEVVTREPTIYINTTPPRATLMVSENTPWFDVTDPMNIPSINKQYGPGTLIAKAVLRNTTPDLDGMSSYVFELKLINPVTSRVIFEGNIHADNTTQLDNKAINPLLNFAQGYLLYYDSTYVDARKGYYDRTLAEWVEGLRYTPP